MNSKIVLFFCLSLIIACQPSSSEDPNSLAALEKAVNDNPSPETKIQLAEAYMKAADTSTDNPNQSAEYLNKAADIYISINRFPQAVKCLTHAIMNHYAVDATPHTALKMAKIYEDKFKKPQISAIIHQALSESHPNSDAAKQLKVNATSPLDSVLTTMSNQLINPETGRIEVSLANDFVASSELACMLLPQKESTPAILQKAGEVARSMRAFPKAIELYEWLYKKYPSSKQAPQALFMQAFTFDNELNKKDKAKELYELFLKSYPEDDFADDTQFLLKNINKTNEEIIQSFGKEEVQ